MGNPFRLKQVLDKLSKLRDIIRNNERTNEVVEVKHEDIDSSKLDDTDFEYSRDDMLVETRKTLFDKLPSEDVDEMLKKDPQKFTQDDGQTVCVISDKTKIPWYFQAKKNPNPKAPVASSSHSEDSETAKPCTLKRRREDRKGLDILHDTICYSQYQMRERQGYTQAEIINDFLNTITNDIVDINKEPIPKDPERLPAIGAAGMYPTKKWLADLKRRNVKPEPNKHYKDLRSRTKPRGGFRRHVNHLLGTDAIYPWTHTKRHTTKHRSVSGKNKRFFNIRRRSISDYSFSD